MTFPLPRRPTSKVQVALRSSMVERWWHGRRVHSLSLPSRPRRRSLGFSEAFTAGRATVELMKILTQPEKTEGVLYGDNAAAVSMAGGTQECHADQTP